MAGMQMRWAWWLVAWLLAWAWPLAAEPAVFRVGSYNLENYLNQPVGTRPAKSSAAKARVRESIRALGAEVLAVQEIGPAPDLEELRQALKREGADYPYSEHVAGADTNVFVGVLSRFPIVARRPHTNEAFLLRGRRFQVSRGFAEVDLEVLDGFRFTLFVAHLKSRRVSAAADESDLREQEAIRLRELLEARLRADPEALFVVAGDLNDTKDSRAVRTLIGRGKQKLVDTRPAEANGDSGVRSMASAEPRTITWTHHFGKEDAYDRIDYLLLSPGMAGHWRREGTRVLTVPDWGEASDHRPIAAAFVVEPSAKERAR
jgi:endonuclease/exonuclease/phosphatase family metal-dependent hydrolase